MELTIRQMESEDWPKVSEIYLQGIQTNLATFASSVPPYLQWVNTHISKLNYVATQNNNIVGFAALSATANTGAYIGVAELSVYVHNDYKGEGIGLKLTQFMLNKAKHSGYWTVESRIMANNEASIKMHEKVGFRIVGTRQKIGKDINGEWRDTVIMEKRNDIY